MAGTTGAGLGPGSGLVAGGLLTVLACGAVSAAQLSWDTSAAAAPAGAIAVSSGGAVPPPVGTTVTAGTAVTVSPPTPGRVAPTMGAAPLPTTEPSPRAPAPTSPLVVTSTPAAGGLRTTRFVYTVQPGDNLSLIAAWFHTHGYGPIYDANRAVIGRNPALIHPGLRIVVVGVSPPAHRGS